MKKARTLYGSYSAAKEHAYNNGMNKLYEPEYKYSDRVTRNA